MNTRRRKERQEQALVRQSVYAELTPQQKISALDSKFGKGQGAKRERARIEASMKKAQTKAETDAKADAQKAEAKAAKKKRGKKEEEQAKKLLDDDSDVYPGS
jgi:hypothetical protein